MANSKSIDGISVTIATFNRKELLERALKALLNQDTSEIFEIIVCDSGSTDGTSQMVRHLADRSAISIRHIQSENILAAKRNDGIKHSNYSVVVFLDDDCIPDTNFISSYADIFRREDVQKLAIYCGEVRFPVPWVEKSNYYRFRDSRHFRFDNLDLNSVKLNFRTIVVMNMAFRKDVFLTTVGSVNEKFVGYGCEDQELGWRFGRYGVSILAAPSRIWHYETSNGISGYATKIARASRDGMVTLIEECSDAAWSLRTSQLFEPTYPGRTFKQYFIYYLCKTLVRPSFTKLLLKYLDATDGVRILYAPMLYRYVLANAYLQGLRERSIRPGVEELKKGW